jgi:hypothetical protein
MRRRIASYSAALAATIETAISFLIVIFLFLTQGHLVPSGWYFTLFLVFTSKCGGLGFATDS